MPSPPVPNRLIAFSGGFLGPSAQARTVRRILDLAGHRPRIGWPGADDAVAAWGHSPRAWRAERAAARTGAALWRIEDAFVRSIRPGRLGGEPPMGLLIDRSGVHYDPSGPSDLETLLASHAFDEAPLIARAKLCIARMCHLHLSKYNAHDLAFPLPEPGYVLVVDQVRDDASLRHGAPDGALPASAFQDMLFAARAENPGARIIIKTHPETAGRARRGHFGPDHADHQVSLETGAVSPWALLEGAIAVYTVSSQLGFEAILAGHRPHVFGHPFYAGWGLTADRNPQPRRGRKLTRAQLFAGAMLLYPHWYDPLRDCLCQLEQVIDQMEARLTAFRQDRQGHVACAVRLWKRRQMQAMFGREKALIFVNDPARAAVKARAGGRGLIGWASVMPTTFPGLRIEDGFLRSRGLGAALTPAQSLVVDDLGIYYDPSRESRLERLIAGPLPPGGAARALSLVEAVTRAGLTKYNIGQDATALTAEIDALRRDRPEAPIILVPGQVEDDASIRLGAGTVRTNRALLEQTRIANPGAVIVYKPHPDVEAGLRPGAVADASSFADLVVNGVDAGSMLGLVDAVWTLTSGLGFEALMRGKSVTCLGTPFYAGWGLTTDLAPVPARRHHLPETAQNGGASRLAALVHATLIAYPRYLDPLTNRPCPPELLVERLAAGQGGSVRPGLRLLAKLQGALAGHAWLWR
ncbi:MAG: capsular polysaccharide export protein [Rhodobacteraceae bacterium HLUCCA12]|nr:MAG: capsular polysaccharide export protein [Rhodobacteraceae bacterium HLUCCA12]